MFVTTFAPTTFPYLLKLIFKSVARVRDDRPETHKLRLNVVVALPLLTGDGAVIFVFTVVGVLVVVVDVDEADTSGISAIIRTENRKFMFNWWFFCVFCVKKS